MAVEGTALPYETDESAIQVLYCINVGNKRDTGH